MAQKLKLKTKKKQKSKTKEEQKIVLSSKHKVALRSLQKQKLLLEMEEVLVMVVLMIGGVIGRSLLQWAPSVEPITFFAILAGMLFGSKKGAITGASSWFLSNFFMFGGQGPWSLIHILAGAFAGFLGGVIKDRRGKFITVAAMISATLFFETAMNVSSGFFFGFGILVSFASALPFIGIHLVSNATFGLLLPKIKGLVYKTGRFNEKEICEKLISKLKEKTKAIKTTTTIVALLFLIPFSQAATIGVVVELPSGAVSVDCLDISDNSDGYQTLSKTDLDLEWAGPSAFGHQLCMINGFGDEANGDYCEYSGKYWGFFKSKGQSWEYLPVGFDGGSSCWNKDLLSFEGHYCAEEGDVIGLNYGEYGDKPVHHSFEELCNPLKVKDVTIRVDNKRQKDADETGGQIEAGPGSTIQFDVSIMNDEQFETDLTVEDIEMEITIDDIKNGLEEKADFKDLDIGEEDEEKISIELPLILEDGDYDIKLLIEGTTNKGISQEISLEYELEINKERHDVEFLLIELEEEKICSGKQIKILVGVANIGKEDENIALTIQIPELGTQKTENIFLEEGDDKDDSTSWKTIQFATSKSITGNYNLVVSADFKEHIEENLQITIEKCAEKAEEQKEPESTNKATGFTTADQKIKTPVYHSYSPKKSFFEKNSSLLILFGTEIIVLLVIIAIIRIMKS